MTSSTPGNRSTPTASPPVPHCLQRGLLRSRVQVRSRWGDGGVSTGQSNVSIELRFFDMYWRTVETGNTTLRVARSSGPQSKADGLTPAHDLTLHLEDLSPNQ